MRNKITIVIPNWNGEKFLSDALSSLESQSQKARIIVVDNGSSDGSVALVNENFPSVDLISLSDNRGFAGGVNAGIKLALGDGSEFIALFNNDAVAEKQWLEALLTTIKKTPNAGIVTGRLLNKSGTAIDSTGDFYSKWGLPYPRGRGENQHGRYLETEEVFGASGGATLYRSAMLKEIGLFDEDFFAYYEDVDLSFRARLAGWSVIYQPEAVAFHRIGATSGGLNSFTRYHSIKNTLLLYFKNMPSPLLFKYLPRLILVQILMLAAATKNGSGVAALKAYGLAFIKIPSTLMKRRTIQSHKEVSSKYIDSILTNYWPLKTRVISPVIGRKSRP